VTHCRVEHRDGNLLGAANQVTRLVVDLHRDAPACPCAVRSCDTEIHFLSLARCSF
jgi:hypothetical protein